MSFRRVNRKQTARSITRPAPIGGLNGRDSLASMGETDATLLDNWFPNATSVDSRPGYTTHCTGLGTGVRTLAEFPGSTPKFLAFGGTNIWDVTTINAPVSLTANDRTSNLAITAMFSNAGGQRMIIVNGSNIPCVYDGATIANLVMTVIADPTKLNFVLGWKGRLYFAEDNKLGFWYLAVNAIQGAMTYFDLSQIAKNGGEIVSIAAVSVDAGSGPDDYILFITSIGEYIMYSGYDPANSANFTLIGRYYSAPPIWRNCAFNYGDELVIITTAGVLPFNDIRRDSGYDPIKDAITSKLGSYYNVSGNIVTQGWGAVVYSKANMLILNIPIGPDASYGYYQYVQNLVTKAWARFTGINAASWCMFGGNPYFGTEDGKVKKFGYLDNAFGPFPITSDDGADIQVHARTAWDYFADEYGGGEKNKHYHFVKILVGWNGQIETGMGEFPPISAILNVDFNDSDPAYLPSSVVDNATFRTLFCIVPVDKYGITSSLSLRCQFSASETHYLKWYATQYMYDRAKGLF